MILVRHRLTLISIVFITLFFYFFFQPFATSFATYLIPQLCSARVAFMLMICDLEVLQDYIDWGQDWQISFLPLFIIYAVLAYAMLAYAMLVLSFADFQASSYKRYSDSK